MQLSRVNIKLFSVVLSFIFVYGAGCSKDALDPTQIGRFRPVPVVNVILESLGVADEPEPAYTGAEDPRPEDVIVYDMDYVFGPGDIVQISIYELRRDGIPFAGTYQVTETGRVSIPDVGQIQAAGLTELELEEEIKEILQPSRLLDPAVTVTLLESQSRLFSVSGRGIFRPNRYSIPRYNFRLTDAIALAGGTAEYNVSYIYVSRDVDVDRDLMSQYTPVSSSLPQGGAAEAKDIKLEQVEPARNGSLGENDLLEIIAPYAKSSAQENEIIISTAEMGTRAELEALTALTEAEKQSTVENTMEELGIGSSEGSRIEWVFEQGKWRPVRVGVQDFPEPVEPVDSVFRDRRLVEPAAPGYGWEEIGGAGRQIRVIKIPVDKLMAGDPRYNIVIRPGDSVTVPLDSVGEVCVTGNVNASGYIDLTGRQMTLMQAIAAAGGLGPLARPEKVEIKRRIGRNSAGLMQELTVMVDLEKIAAGLQPDFYIKRDDTINVGTDGTSRWLAVLRNSFRATYGFGFIYDRNFASRDFGNDPFPGHMSMDKIF